MTPENPDPTHASNPTLSSGAFPSLDQLARNIPPVTWLWPGWIPHGMITLSG